MQYRSPVGLGPSLKTWPRWASQTLHRTSVRFMKKLESVFVSTLLSEMGAVKLGHPVPDSNLALELNRSLPQQTHL
jgi:hypothetical protein